LSKKEQHCRTTKKRAVGERLGKTGLYVTLSLVAALIIGGVWLLIVDQPASSASPLEVAAEIIPQKGDPTSYGIPLSLDNTQQFIDYYNEAVLTPDQEHVMHEALVALKAPCCDDNSMATCCCPCNLAKSVWGLSSFLIVEKGYGIEEVRESALDWLRFIQNGYYIAQELKVQGINPDEYDLPRGDSCYTGRCELPFTNDGCGGMNVLVQ
jgi:hypothetical protein